MTANKIRAKTSNIDKTKLWIGVWFQVIWFTHDRYYNHFIGLKKYGKTTEVYHSWYFTSLTENSSSFTNDIQGSAKILQKETKGNMFDMALKLPSYFYLVIEKPLEPKNDKNQHYWQESPVFISLNQSQLM